jgi:hypothetical protein
MVRHKNRFMLVRLEFFEGKRHMQVVVSQRQQPDWFPTSKDFVHALRECVTCCFGTSASDAAMDVQGTSTYKDVRLLYMRFLDSHALRVSAAYCLYNYYCTLE